LYPGITWKTRGVKLSTDRSKLLQFKGWNPVCNLWVIP
jgi:hypothetical protein